MKRTIPATLCLALVAIPAAAERLDHVPWHGAYVGGNLDFQNGLPDGPGLISLHAGRDGYWGDLIVGAEVEVSNADAGAPTGMITWMTRAKLRLGMPVGRTFAYTTAGGVRAETSTGPEYGAFAGIGIEHRLSRRWTVGGEWLYHHFPNYDGGPDHDVQSLSARISYRF